MLVLPIQSPSSLAPALAANGPPGKPPRPPAVFVALPTYNGWHKSQAITGLLLATSRAHLHYELGFGSLLATNFNQLLCTARNSRPQCPWSHFAMHHADLSAPEGWLDTLLDEMDRVGADVLSAVVAIKDERRLSSSGAVQGDGSIRRLTLKEVHRLPETFSAADLPSVGVSGSLVVNTGLFLCRFNEPWADEFHFHIGDGIQKKPNGMCRPVVAPEDWNWSHWCNQRGLKIFATRKLFIQHWDGGTAWDNGTHSDGWDYDLGDDPDRYDEVRAAREAERTPAAP